MSDQDTGAAGGQAPEEPENGVEERLARLEERLKRLEEIDDMSPPPPVIPVSPSFFPEQPDRSRAAARALVADEVIGRLKRAISAFMADPEEENRRVVPKDEKFSGA